MCALAPCGPAQLAAGPVHVRFQLGLFREEVRVPAGNLTYRHAKRLAAEVIERKVSKVHVRDVTAVMLKSRRHQPRPGQDLDVQQFFFFFVY